MLADVCLMACQPSASAFRGTRDHFARLLAQGAPHAAAMELVESSTAANRRVPCALAQTTPMTAFGPATPATVARPHTTEVHPVKLRAPLVRTGKSAAGTERATTALANVSAMNRERPSTTAGSLAKLRHRTRAWRVPSTARVAKAFTVTKCSSSVCCVKIHALGSTAR